MKLLRFLVWTAGLRLCDLVGSPVNRLAVWYEHVTPWEAPFYSCRLHPDWLIRPASGIPESWWSRTGWRKP